ncbi:MAG: hypothetical protein A2V88_17630 [Elusimicrobia bacterium RBG_16_66_12]|nr:MAG: hypothetical protein A2V88_17630 [Elusimicrobia bacterium RBG_16_66_12]
MVQVAAVEALARSGPRPSAPIPQAIDARAVRLALYRALGFEMHRGQREIDECEARFIVACWGRQGGKSKWLAHRYIADAAIAPPGSIIWHVAPEYNLAQPVFLEHFLPAARRLKHLTADFYLQGWSERDLIARFSNGVKVECKSADNIGSLQGRTLYGLGFDECATVNDSRVWEQYLRPAVAVNRSRVYFISTPKGRNWFFDIYRAGTDPHQPEWAAFRMASDVNPYIPADEFAHAKRTLPERVFRQEWLAEFIEDASSVFRGVKECVGGSLQEPVKNRHYVAGLDLAKHLDFSVLVVVDAEARQVVHFERYREVDWHRQLASFAATCRRYNNARCLLDSTGLGDPIYDFLQRAGLWVEPMNLQGGRKFDLISCLSLAIENRDIRFPKIEELINELLIYEYSTTKAGNLKMGVGHGYHDDCVIALALATWMLQHGAGQIACLRKGRMF